jgi:hypothetical protein
MPLWEVRETSKHILAVQWIPLKRHEIPYFDCDIEWKIVGLVKADYLDEGFPAVSNLII